MESSDLPPSATPQPAPLHVPLAWAVIWLLVGLIAVFQNWQLLNPPPIPPESAPGLEMLVAGRLSVAADQLNPRAAAGVFDDLRHLAQAPADQLRLAAVEGEMNGAQAALARLDAIEAAHPDLPPPVRDDLQTFRQLYTHPDQEPTPDQRQQLIDRHGWFGQLALSYDRPASDPLRRSILTRAWLTLITAVAALLGIVAILAAGFVLCFVMAALLASRKLRAAYTPWPAPRAVPFLETVALFLVVFVAAQVVGGLVLTFTGLNLSPLMYLAIPLPLLWPLLRSVSLAQWREALGWHAGRGVLREIGLGIVGYLAGMPLLLAGIVVSAILSQFSGTQASHPIQFRIASGSLPQLLGLLVLAAVWAPLVEESIFRGAFYHYLRSRHSVMLSAVLTGLIFALLHPQGYLGLPTITALGVLFALIRQWRGSIIACVAAHALNNFLITLMLILMVG